MSKIDKDYELKVLKMVVNKYLDETMSATEENLKALETNRDAGANCIVENFLNYIYAKVSA